MLVHLGLAFALVCLSVVVHGLGTTVVIARLAGALRPRDGGRGGLTSAVLTARLVSGLLVLHLVEAAAWAGMYWLAGTLPDPEAAFYFSLTSYTTVGYGDVVLPADRRLLGPTEAATGILMFGWSTGVMVAVITQIYGDQLRHLAKPAGTHAGLPPGPEKTVGSPPPDGTA